jgi:hypothetical protein
MFLAFPLDYQLDGFMLAAVAPFGRLLFWRQCRNKSVSLAHCLLLDPSRVPRSVVVSQGSAVGGNNRSWSVPTYILGGNLGIEIGDEDPIPVDGNPHHAQGAPMAGNANVYQNWIHDLVGAGNQVLAEASIDVNMMQEVNQEIQPGQNVAGQNLANVQGQASSAQSGIFGGCQRASGPDVYLNVEEILAAIQREASSDY